MRTRKTILKFGVLMLITGQVCAQDPNFSQFFSSPLNMNPALTGAINSDWRLVSNLRTQWIGPANPYVTGTVSYDAKMFNRKIIGVEERNRAAVGGMLMFDEAMQGIVKSTYASLNFTYNILLSSGAMTHRLGAGFGGSFGNRFVNFDRLYFQDQFTGDGFDTNLPTGETALARMKPYLSASMGLLYSASSAKSNFDLGAAMFHLNKPRQTWLSDENEFLPIRYVSHANFDRYLNSSLILNLNGTYQFQREAQYYSIGGALGYHIGGREDLIFNAGLWYWSENAITPYVGLIINRMQFGVSYDATISKLRDAPRPANTFEISFIIRGEKAPVPGVPCPWK